jgi:hypothetical protein
MATNQERLQSVIQTHATSQLFVEEFQHFHLSVKQKLWSADYFQDRIDELEPEVLYRQKGTENILIPDQYQGRERFGLYANLILDGFLMNSMAALDTLAHEIKILYAFLRIPRKVYIHIIEQKLRSDHPHKRLTTYLSGELAKTWYNTLSEYRHCTTHESLVGSNVRSDETLITGDIQQAMILLPDDPRNRPFTYTRNRELKSYCAKARKNVANLVRHSYYCIVQDIRAAHNTLPIP